MGASITLVQTLICSQWQETHSTGLESKDIPFICKQINLKTWRWHKYATLAHGFPLLPRQFVTKEINISDLGLQLIKLLGHLPMTPKKVFVDA